MRKLIIVSMLIFCWSFASSQEEKVKKTGMKPLPVIDLDEIPQSDEVVISFSTGYLRWESSSYKGGIRVFGQLRPHSTTFNLKLNLGGIPSRCEGTGFYNTGFTTPSIPSTGRPQPIESKKVRQLPTRNINALNSVRKFRGIENFCWEHYIFSSLGVYHDGSLIATYEDSRYRMVGKIFFHKISCEEVVVVDWFDMITGGTPPAIEGGFCFY